VPQKLSGPGRERAFTHVAMMRVFRVHKPGQGVLAGAIVGVRQQRADLIQSRSPLPRSRNLRREGLFRSRTATSSSGSRTCSSSALMREFIVFISERT
jgi:hypothetical protein